LWNSERATGIGQLAGTAEMSKISQYIWIGAVRPGLEKYRRRKGLEGS